MKRRTKLASSIFALMGGVLALDTSVVLAHHPIEAKFDSSKKATMTGRVTAVDWRNPHTHVFMNVDNSGGEENWAIELESPIVLRHNGWSDQSLQPGDEITVEGLQARDGTRQIWGESLTLAGTGRAVYAVTEQKPALPLSPRPVPHWPDGSIALGSTNGAVDGYWSFPSKTVLVEDGVDVQMDQYGLLSDLDDAAKVAPMQPWALGLYKHRQERSLQDDPMYLNCKPPGGPRQYQSNLGFQLLEDKENSRIFALIGSGNRNFRIIYMDGRTQTGLVTGDDDNPLYYGRSTAHWEGETLVVSTKGFNEDFWFSNGGLPHTNLLEMEERFTRPNADTLEYAVTINDPGAYTRAWSASWTMQWVGGEELPVHFCQNNRQ